MTQIASKLRRIPVLSSIIRFALLLAATCACSASQAQTEKRVTILYDAFGPPSNLKLDWGFAALVEYGGKRILFDTGNNAKIFEHNVKELAVDLKQLDAVIISHRHGDHTSGLSYLLQVNPSVKIYAPVEAAQFKGPMPIAFLKREPGLPPTMSYYRGQNPEQFVSGSPWPDANFEIIRDQTEIFPGFFVLTTISEKPGTRDMNELSLAIRTPEGLAVIVGCSHPGIEKILGAAAKIDPQLYTATGGFHLVVTAPEEVERVAALLDETLKIKRVAPGHCTSEFGFQVFMSRFRDRFDQAGAGRTIALP
jgi:7,8-dihydropterin-6-yl-methyl-4-(beta-D-ribofuranosyl)aminobenzene 5'-phosphate synthase